VRRQVSKPPAVGGSSPIRSCRDELHLEKKFMREGRKTTALSAKRLRAEDPPTELDELDPGASLYGWSSRSRAIRFAGRSFGAGTKTTDKSRSKSPAKPASASGHVPRMTDPAVRPHHGRTELVVPQKRSIRGTAENLPGRHTRIIWW